MNATFFLQKYITKNEILLLTSNSVKLYIVSQSLDNSTLTNSMYNNKKTRFNIL